MRLLILSLHLLSVTALLCLSSLNAQALETQPGDACSTANQIRNVGGPENPGAGHILICNGSNWISVKEWNPSTGQSFFQIGNDTGGCTAAKNGRIRFDSSNSPPWEYCNGSAWSPFKQPRCQNNGTGACYAAQVRMTSDPDFIPENIASGKVILGVAGTFVKGMTTTAIAAGLSAACAVNGTGVARCWGMGLQGQLGDGNFNTPNGPVTVSDGSTTGTAWTHIATGQVNSCGIRNDGTAWCWGQGTYGANGNGLNTAQSTPAAVSTSGVSGTAWTAIDVGGFYSCGIRDNGTGWCWGVDSSGTLGNGAITGNKNVPDAIDLTGVSGTGWTTIKTGYAHTCGIRNDGTAWCWGRGTEGQIGNSGTSGRTAPTAVNIAGVSGSNWTNISVSIGYHVCGIRDDGTAWCWGYGEDGELGNGTNPAAQSTPVQVSTTGVSGTAWISVSTSQWSSCGIRNDNTAWCWGYNSYGQLGNHSTIPENTPVLVDTTTVTGTGWTYMEGGGLFMCGIRNDNTGWCWGDPTYGATTNIDFGAIKPVAY